MTRTFTIIAGPGVHLDFEGEGRGGRWTATSRRGLPAPRRPSADCVRLRGATAFNLLTRDGAASGDVAIRRGRAAEDALPVAGLIVFHAIEEAWSLTVDGETVVVHQGAAAQVEGPRRSPRHLPHRRARAGGRDHRPRLSLSRSRDDLDLRAIDHGDRPRPPCPSEHGQTGDT